MSLRPEEITIAVTVFSRRDFLKKSIGSALQQSVPVRVMVIEDCGPDLGMRDYVRGLFGDQVEYFRNERRRGIFGNWNACIERCPTRWLSILHDDDWLEPGFVEAMLELNQQAGDKGLYFGQTTVIDSEGKERGEWRKPSLGAPWLPVTLTDVLSLSPFSFPGQLFQVAAAKSCGGFRETSHFTGEWELWTKIIAHYGGARTDRTVAVFRNHTGWDRGTSRIYRSGKTLGLTTIQRKRNLALARRLGITIPTRYLLYYAKFFSPMYLRYNTNRLLRSDAPHLPYRLFQLAVRMGGPRLVRLVSLGWNKVRKPK
jgi:glycosyltransferase involved in cell wall biosynthesis